MGNIEFSQYKTDYIAGVMSLREPQKESLKRLEQITEIVPLNKDMDLGVTFRRNAEPISAWTDHQTKEIHRAIVMMNKVSIGKEIYQQLLQHFKIITGFLEEEVIDVVNYNVRQQYNCKYNLNLFAAYATRIQNIVFTGIKKGVFEEAKFDSEPELVLARVLEQDYDVKNWFRPASSQFNITYNHGHRYEPDFVVEAEMLYILSK